MTRTTPFSVSGQLAQPPPACSPHQSWARSWKAWFEYVDVEHRARQAPSFIEHTLHVLEGHDLTSGGQDGDAVA